MAFAITQGIRAGGYKVRGQELWAFAGVAHPSRRMKQDDVICLMNQEANPLNGKGGACPLSRLTLRTSLQIPPA